MKKFSNISGEKINSEPKIENSSKKSEELDVLKYSLLELMNQFLRIESYGSARKNILPTVKITGRELFIEALLDMISDKSFKDQIKALESLKSKSRDWETIDESINLINQEVQRIEEMKSLKNHIKKVQSLLDIYGDDEDNFKFIVEEYSNKIKDSNIAYHRAIAAKVMMESPKFKEYSKTNLEMISEKFLERARGLK